jgi:hypothetical protein
LNLQFKLVVIFDNNLLEIFDFKFAASLLCVAKERRRKQKNFVYLLNVVCSLLLLRFATSFATFCLKSKISSAQRTSNAKQGSEAKKQQRRGNNVHKKTTFFYINYIDKKKVFDKNLVF